MVRPSRKGLRTVVRAVGRVKDYFQRLALAARVRAVSALSASSPAVLPEGSRNLAGLGGESRTFRGLPSLFSTPGRPLPVGEADH